MAINFKDSPYFDDFDPDNNFYKVLFKPGYAVQARELNQLQSILQHQVAAIGNHLFKKNSMVIPGGISLNSSVDIVAVTIGDPSVLVGKTITNATVFDPDDDSTLDGSITAVVLAAQQKTDTIPASIYVKYFKTAADGTSKFGLNDVIRTVDQTVLTFGVDNSVGSTIGKAATIARGVFYTKDTFVDVAPQSLIIETRNTTVTNCIIGLNVITSIVTSDEDESLLDNALGSPNQYAPGADRYKITLELARIDPTTEISDDNFITLMKIENDVVTFQNVNTQYAEIMKMLARRTYDANGNFVVEGLDTSVVKAADDEYVWANITSGRCYLGGYEYSQIANTPIAIDKPRGPAYQRSSDQVIKYTSEMAYLYVAGGTYLKEIPAENSLVRFLNAAPGTANASVIGYGIFKGMQYAQGDITSNRDVYKMFFEYVSLEKGYTHQHIGGVVASSVSEGTAVLHRLTLTSMTGAFNAGDTIQATTGVARVGVIHNVTGNTVFIVKSTLNFVPSGDVVIDTTTNSTASVSQYFITNYTDKYVPMIEVSSDIYKTLYANNANSTSYSVIVKTTHVVPSAENTQTITFPTTLGANDTFDTFSTSNYFAFKTNPGEEDTIDLTSVFSLTNGGKKYSITFPDTTYAGKTIDVYSTIVKANVTESQKTLTTTTVTIPIPTKSWMALRNQDVVSIMKIVDGGLLSIKTADWSSNSITFTVPDSSPHGLAVGDVVVVSGINGAVGFNGTHTVASIPSTTQFVVTKSGSGVYVSGGQVTIPPDINTGVDITNRYILDTGNTPYLSGTGMIKLKNGAIAPQGQIAVQYQYYALGTGNYVSVDSYGTYSGDLSYIGEIANIGQYETRRYIDFRSRPSNYFFQNIGSVKTSGGLDKLVLKDLNLSSFDFVGGGNALVGKAILGPGFTGGSTTISAVSHDVVSGDTTLTLSSGAATDVTGTYYIGLDPSTLSIADPTAGAHSFSIPKDATRISYQYVKFLPRNIMLYVNRVGDILSIMYKDVVSLAEVYRDRRNEFRLPLAYVEMKPYTVSVQDIKLTKIENPVYKMLDIHELKKRIERNEYYTSLSLSTDLHKAILDAQNETMDESQKGMWNEDFLDPFTQDFSSSDFACTIYDKSYVAPGTVVRTVPLVNKTDNSATWQKTGSAFTLPYTEVRAFGNDKASTFNNLNPFNAIQWNGKLVLNPSVDNWVDTTSSLSSTVNTTATPAATGNQVTVNNQMNVNIVSQTNITVPAPVVITQAPPVLPAPPVEEIVTEVNNLKTSWGPDSAGGRHAITFDWVTNLGRSGRVNTDIHLSTIVSSRGHNGTYARSLINRRYNDNDVKQYLNAGTHFDQRPPSAW